MSLAGDLAPKVAEIEERARELYGMYLSSWGLKLDGDLLVEDDDATLPLEPPDVLLETSRWLVFRNTLNELLRRFQEFYPLDSAELSELVRNLGGREEELRLTGNTGAHARIHRADDDWMQRVDGLINERLWSGAAATTFHEQFLLPFHRTAEQQMACVKELGIAAQCFREATNKIEDDVNTIVDACLDTLRNPHGDGPGGFLTVVGIVAGAVGLFVSGPVGLGIEVVSLGAGILSFLSEEAGNEQAEPEAYTVSGLNGPMIIESTWDALVKLDQLVADLDDRIWNGLNKDLDSPYGFASRRLTLDRPEVADQRQAQFGELPPSASSVPPERDVVVVETVSVYRAGQVNRPKAADLYGDALTNVRTLHTPLWLHGLFPRSVPLFHDARNRLADILRDTRTSLRDAGIALVQCAENYQFTDEQSAEVHRQIEEINSPTPPPVDHPSHHGPSRGGV